MVLLTRRFYYWAAGIPWCKGSVPLWPPRCAECWCHRGQVQCLQLPEVYQAWCCQWWGLLLPLRVQWSYRQISAWHYKCVLQVLDAMQSRWPYDPVWGMHWLVSPCLYRKDHQRSKETWAFFLWKLCCWKAKEIERIIRTKDRNCSMIPRIWSDWLNSCCVDLSFYYNKTGGSCNHLILLEAGIDDLASPTICNYINYLILLVDHLILLVGHLIFNVYCWRGKRIV